MANSRMPTIVLYATVPRRRFNKSNSVTSTDSEQHSLQRYREQLDLLNTQLLHLIELRGEVVLEVMNLKQRQGLPISDPSREQAMLESLWRQARGPFQRGHIEQIFSSIFAASRALGATNISHDASGHAPRESAASSGGTGRAGASSLRIEQPGD